MTREVKSFDPAVLCAFTTGVLMTDFSPVHEAAEWLMGHPVWTHELPRLSDAMKAEALRQYPHLPTEIVGHWEDVRDKARIDFGDAVPVERGQHVRSADPITTARQAISAATGQQEMES